MKRLVQIQVSISRNQVPAGISVHEMYMGQVLPSQNSDECFKCIHSRGGNHIRIPKAFEGRTSHRAQQAKELACLIADMSGVFCEWFQSQGNALAFRFPADLRK